MTDVLINSFNSGIYSKRLKVRTDFDKRTKAVEELDNSVVMREGGVERRSGTKLAYDSVARQHDEVYNELSIRQFTPQAEQPSDVVIPPLVDDPRGPEGVTTPPPPTSGVPTCTCILPAYQVDEIIWGAHDPISQIEQAGHNITIESLDSITLDPLSNDSIYAIITNIVTVGSDECPAVGGAISCTYDVWYDWYKAGPQPLIENEIVDYRLLRGQKVSPSPFLTDAQFSTFLSGTPAVDGEFFESISGFDETYWYDTGTTGGFDTGLVIQIVAHEWAFVPGATYRFTVYGEGIPYQSPPKTPEDPLNPTLRRIGFNWPGDQSNMVEVDVGDPAIVVQDIVADSNLYGNIFAQNSIVTHVTIEKL